MTSDNKLLDVNEVAEFIDVSKSYAYRIIRRLNEELKASGHYVVPGKANKAYLAQKYFGVPEAATMTEEEI